MTIATVVKAWKDSTRAFVAVRIEEEGGAVEYIGESPLVDNDGNAKTAAVLKAECVADIKMQRSAQIATIADVAMTGTITL